MTARAFIDLDGALTDAGPGIARSILHALEALGLPPPTPEALIDAVGPPLSESFLKFGVAEADVDKALGLYRDRYVSIGVFENSVYAGAPEILTRLRAQGFRLALATSKPLAYAARITAHFGLAPLLDRQIRAELDGTRADKRDLIAFALAKTGTAPGDSIMLGDRMQDARGALYNRVAPIGALWGYGSRRELEQAGCLALAATPHAVPGLVESCVRRAADKRRRSRSGTE